MKCIMLMSRNVSDRHYVMNEMNNANVKERMK